MKNKLFILYIVSIISILFMYQGHSIQNIRNTIQTQEKSINELQTQLKEKSSVSRGSSYRTLTVLATAYCPCTKCCGLGATGHTKTGTVATQDRTIAVDPKYIPLGSKVLIYGHEYIAEDTGGAIKGNRIDIFYNSHQEALKFGVQRRKITIVD